MKEATRLIEGATHMDSRATKNISGINTYCRNDNDDRLDGVGPGMESSTGRNREIEATDSFPSCDPALFSSCDLTSASTKSSSVASEDPREWLLSVPMVLRGMESLRMELNAFRRLMISTPTEAYSIRVMNTMDLGWVSMLESQLQVSGSLVTTYHIGT